MPVSGVAVQISRTMAVNIKGAVSRQSLSFYLILPITRPQSLWNLKYAKKLHANDKIRDPRQTNMSPEHYFCSCKQRGSTLKTVRLNSFQKP